MKTHVDEKGSPYDIENRVDLSLLPEKSWIKHIYKAIDLLKEGSTRSITAQLISEQTGIEAKDLDTVITAAVKVIEDEYCKKSDTVIGLHVTRYDRDIKEILNRNFNRYSEAVKVKMKIGAYLDLLNILYSKEKLLQLHNKKVVFRLNQKKTTVVREVTPKYDISNLTLQEKIDFLELINKSKKTSSELAGVILKDRTKENVTIDIDHEDVTETNVEKIKQIAPEEEKVIPASPPILDITEKIKQRLLEKQAEALREVGSKM